MASWSGFGFSGWDPISSFGEYSLADYFNRRSMAQQYKYAIKGMKEAPSARVAGLRAAGLNPILAAGSAGAGGVDVSSDLNVQNNQSSVGSMDDWLNLKYGKKQRQAEIDLLKSQERRQNADASAAKMNAEANQWRVMNANDMVQAGMNAIFKVDGHWKSSKCIRINKVTGQTFDALTNKPIEHIDYSNPSSPTNTKNLQAIVNKLEKEHDRDERQIIRRELQKEIDRRSNQSMPKKWQGWHWKDGKLKFPAFGSGMW